MPGVKKGLTQKQKRYCRERAAGKSQRQAYQAAYDAENMLDKTCREEACRLEMKPEVKAELNRLTALAESGAILTRQQRMSILSEMAYDQTRRDDSRQRALDMLNRMTGDYTDRVITEVTASVDLSIEDKRAAVLDALRND